MAGKREDFSYLQIPNRDELLNWPTPETFKEKMLRKTKENPMVPLGLSVTVFALTYGLWQMKSGNKAMSQKMMRLRVAAQSFTVVSLLGGVLYSAHKSRKERENRAQAN